MPDKKKGLAAIIIAKAKPKSMMEKDTPENDELDMAAEEIMMAIDEKDPKMLKDSLKAFIEMCQDYHQDTEEV